MLPSEHHIYRVHVKSNQIKSFICSYQYKGGVGKTSHFLALNVNYNDMSRTERPQGSYNCPGLSNYRDIFLANTVIVFLFFLRATAFFVSIMLSALYDTPYPSLPSPPFSSSPFTFPLSFLPVPRQTQH